MAFIEILFYSHRKMKDPYYSPRSMTICPERRSIPFGKWTLQGPFCRRPKMFTFLPFMLYWRLMRDIPSQSLPFIAFWLVMGGKNRVWIQFHLKASFAHPELGRNKPEQCRPLFSSEHSCTITKATGDDPYTAPPGPRFLLQKSLKELS